MYTFKNSDEWSGNTEDERLFEFYKETVSAVKQMEMNLPTSPEDARDTLENTQETTQISMNGEDLRNILENARETTQTRGDGDNTTLPHNKKKLIIVTP
ncbi:hypothetical protein JTB14_015051 [Gonioctena quinquepunctata]|nr:hypothetical protein JTB14_015051 [Gonioctena quinquepunctata]